MATNNLHATFAFRALRAVTAVLFGASMFLLLVGPFIDVAPRKLKVSNEKHEAIGYAQYRPAEGDTAAITFCVALLSGLQLWTLRYVARTLASQ